MKTFRILLFSTFSLISSLVFAQKSVTDTIWVNGECGMCKSRIEKTLKVEGINSAGWNTETKLLVVNYNPEIISNDDIQKKVVAVGHDTEKYSAPDEVYAKLPGCCKYERKGKKM